MSTMTNEFTMRRLDPRDVDIRRWVDKHGVDRTEVRIREAGGTVRVVTDD